MLCKPKLLPLNSVTLEKLEKMQKEANTRAKEMQEEANKEQEVAKEGGFIGGQESNADVMTIHHDDE